MAVEQRRKKGSVNGKMASSVSSPKSETVIARVASFLKNLKPQAVRYAHKIPGNRPLGERSYTVRWKGEPIIFKKRKDAEALKLLLSQSTQKYEAVIIRNETTEEGYIPTYGDRK